MLVSSTNFLLVVRIVNLTAQYYTCQCAKFIVDMLTGRQSTVRLNIQVFKLVNTMEIGFNPM